MAPGPAIARPQAAALAFAGAPHPQVRWVPAPAPSTPSPSPSPAAAPPSGAAPAGAPASAPGTGTDGPAARKRSAGATAWTVVLAIDLSLLGLSLLLAAIGYFTGSEALQEETAQAATDPSLIYLNSALILVMGGIIPFLWVLGTRVRAWEGTVLYLGLQRPLRQLGVGALWGFGLIGAVLVVAFLFSYADQELGTNTTENPQLEALLDVITWPMAFFIAFCAAVGEEILYRGLLQKWIGYWGQAVAFGLSHASYGTPLQIVIPFGVGLVFGLFVKRGMGLWVPMAAHFVYDFTVASSPLWAGDSV